MPRPKFVPTAEQRKTVRTMAGFGIPQDDIAAHLEIAPKTLRKHFKQELRVGAIHADARVIESLYKMATSGESAAATIFWVKTRCRWRENSVPAESAPPEFHLHVVEPTK